MESTIKRIRRMELYFDILQSVYDSDPEALICDPTINAILKSLTDYYAGGQWLKDYELDETGLLPKDLKRGVLSEDSLYDFFDKIKNYGHHCCE